VAAVVVDASIIVDLLANQPNSEPLERLLARGRDQLVVPALCDLEVASSIRGGVIRGTLSISLSESLLDDYLSLPLERHGHEMLLPRVLQLADNFTAYDAVYVALAERLGASLITSDARLARAVAAHTEVTALD